MGKQPQPDSEWMVVVSFNALHHPDHSHGQRGNYQGCGTVFSSECGCSIGTRIIPSSRAESGKCGGMLRAGESSMKKLLTMMRTVRESRGDYAAISLKSHGRSHYQDHCATGVKAVGTTLGELFTSGTWEQRSVKQNLWKEDPALSFLPLFDLPLIWSPKDKWSRLGFLWHRGGRGKWRPDQEGKRENWQHILTPLSFL